MIIHKKEKSNNEDRDEITESKNNRQWMWQHVRQKLRRNVKSLLLTK